jgi:hypothetical protein
MDPVTQELTLRTFSRMNASVLRGDQTRGRVRESRRDVTREVSSHFVHQFYMLKRWNQGPIRVVLRWASVGCKKKIGLRRGSQKIAANKQL